MIQDAQKGDACSAGTLATTGHSGPFRFPFPQKYPRKGIAMDLEEFVSASLLQIVRGVASSAGEISQLGGAVNPAFAASSASGPQLLGMSKDGDSTPIYGVSFDVALVVGSSADAEGGAKLQVATIFSAGGKVKSGDRQESTNRLQFVVPLQLPTDAQSKANWQKREEEEAALLQRRARMPPLGTGR